MNRKLILLLIALLLGFLPARAEPARITAVLTQNGTHAYFHDLLIAAFAAGGRPVVIDGVPAPARPRIRRMLESGELTVMWMMQSAQNDQEFVPVQFPIAEGLAGRRILLIRPQDQVLFDRINSLEDLRQSGLVAGLGNDWADLGLWQANQLPAITPVADPRRLYDMLRVGNRGVDYIPRAANGILADAATYPGLVPEKRLLLTYHREGRFYLSPAAADLRPVLEAGLKALRDNGTLTRLRDKHLGATIEALAFDRRVVLTLRDEEKLN